MLILSIINGQVTIEHKQPLVNWYNMKFSVSYRKVAHLREDKRPISYFDFISKSGVGLP